MGADGPRTEPSFDARVRDVFDRAMEVPASRRGEFLASACAGDERLAREVASLLDLGPDADEFLGTPPGSIGDSGVGSKPPDRIGRYRIRGLLGRGGMGVVYEAEDEATGQRAALKTVAVPSADLLAGIRREIHALARIRHPGVVRIVDEGIWNGVPWYAMELVEGMPLYRHVRGEGEHPAGSAAPTVRLSELLAEGASGGAASPQLPLRRTLTIVRRLCTTLAHLHGEGVVHRDLKPGNIVVRPGDVPVILDFGLTTLFPAATSREALEVYGDAVGTADYIAPEQGHGMAVDARADLYAVGCILYELLTGHPPFAAPTPVESLRRRYIEDALPPSHATSGIPPALDALVMRLLAREPRDRTGHASQVAWELGELGADGGWPDPTPIGRSYLYRPGLAGRDELLGAMTDRLPLRGRAGGMMLLGGESGVGKTRLLMSLAAAARDAGMLVLTGQAARAAPARGSGAAGELLGALQDVLAFVADRCREHRDEARRLLGPQGRALGAVAPVLSDVPGIADLPEPAPLPPKEAQERVLDVLVSMLVSVAAPRGLLLVLDDLHDADELTLALLAHLAQGDALEARLLVVGSYRTEEVTPALGALLDVPSVIPVPVGRLDPAAVAAIVADMLAMAPPPNELVSALAVQSEGNPFLVAEYLHVAVAERLIGLDPQGRWRIEGAGTDAAFRALPLPGSIHELVGRRLAALDHADRAVLEAASVLGRAVDPVLVQRVSGAPEEAVREATTALLAIHLLDQGPSGQLGFSHDKLREGAYAAIAPERREALHRRAAEALEERDRSPATAAARARHWDLGDRPDLARPRYRDGARHSAASYAHADAERLYRRYLALEKPGVDAVLARLELGEQVLPYLGRYEDSLAEQEAALQMAREIGNPVAEARARLGTGMALQRLTETARAQQALEEALRSLEGLGDTDGTLRARLSLARLLLRSGDVGPGRRLAEETLPMARAAGHRMAEAEILSTLAVDAHHRGLCDEALRIHQDALVLLREMGDRRREAIALANMGTALTGLLRFDEAERLNDEALDAIRSCGDRRMLAYHLLNILSYHLDRGAIDRCDALAEEALKLFRAVGDRYGRAIAIAKRANVRRDQGDRDAASADHRLAIELLEPMGQVRPLGYLYSNEAEISLERGLFREALELIARSVDILRRVQDHRGLAGSLSKQAGMLRLIHGDLVGAERLLAEAGREVDASGDAAIRGEWLYERGRLRLARGELPWEEIVDLGTVIDSLRIGSESHLGRLLDRLKRTSDALLSGEKLHRGVRREELPELLGTATGSEPA